MGLSSWQDGDISGYDTKGRGSGAGVGAEGQEGGGMTSGGKKESGGGTGMKGGAGMGGRDEIVPTEATVGGGSDEGSEEEDVRGNQDWEDDMAVLRQQGGRNDRWEGAEGEGAGGTGEGDADQVGSRMLRGNADGGWSSGQARASTSSGATSHMRDSGGDGGSYGVEGMRGSEEEGVALLRDGSSGSNRGLGGGRDTPSGSSGKGKDVMSGIVSGGVRGDVNGVDAVSREVERERHRGRAAIAIAAVSLGTPVLCGALSAGVEVTGVWLWCACVIAGALLFVGGSIALLLTNEDARNSEFGTSGGAWQVVVNGGAGVW